MPSLYAADVQLGKPTKIATTTDANENAKPKRTLSEETKQKLKEARERKKQERLDAALREETAQKEAAEAARQVEADKQAKKEAAAAKRRETRLKRKAEHQQPAKDEVASETSASGSEPPAAPTPKPKRQRKAKTPDLSASDIEETKKATTDQPPQWFTKFVTTIMTEKKEQEGLKATKKELKAEGEKAAEKKWADSYTRDRIRHAVDGHLGQMYSMIFR